MGKGNAGKNIGVTGAHLNGQNLLTGKGNVDDGVCLSGKSSSVKTNR